MKFTVFRGLIVPKNNYLTFPTNKTFESPFGPDKVFSEKPGSVFVFGSNLAGCHGGGAALAAYKKYHAVWGMGFGYSSIAGQNNIGSYAIPTKDFVLKTLRYTEVAYWIQQFAEWCVTNTWPTEVFVTKIGCGLAGFTEEMIAPLFRRHYWHGNVILPAGW
jgi:hypothetical protein